MRRYVSGIDCLGPNWPSSKEWQKLLDPFSAELIADAYRDIAEGKRDDGVETGKQRMQHAREAARIKRLSKSKSSNSSVSV